MRHQPYSSELGGHLLRRFSAAAAIFAFSLLGRHIWDQRLLPATGVDSLIYHLALPAYWLQRGYLAPLDLPFQPGTVEQPMFAETIAYAMLYFSRGDTWTWLIQPLFFLHLLWLFFLTARRLGASTSVAAALTAHLALFTPFTRNIVVFNNDVILAWATAVFGMGICCLHRPSRRSLLLAAGGAGLLMATKAVGIIYAAAGLAAIFVFMLASRALIKSAWSWKWSTLLTAFLLVLGGGIFMVRNFVIYGNPFYPNEMRVGGHLIFPGLYDLAAVAGRSFSWRDLATLFLSGKDFASSMLDGPAFALGLIVLGIAFLRSAKMRRARCLLVLFWPLFAAVLYFALFPNWPDPRFLFPLYYGLWLAIAHAAAIGCPGARRWVLTIILIWLAIRLYLLAPVGAWPWGIFAAVFGMMLTPARLRQLIPIFATIAAAAIFLSAPWWHAEYLRRREIVRPRTWQTLYGSYGRAWHRLWQMSFDNPLCIAYTGTSWLFPLFGPQLKNRVLYLPISREDKPHAVTLQPGEWPVKPSLNKRRRASDDDFWLKRMQQEGVDVLLVCDNPAYGGAAPEEAMIHRHAERFQLIFADGEVRIYAVQKQR